MKQFKGYLYGIISSATFGLIPLFSLPVLSAGVGLESVMFYRFSLSVLFLGLLLLLKRVNLKITFSEFKVLFVLGALYAFTALLLTNSYLYIPSGIATTIHFLYPVMVSGISVLFYKDRLSKKIITATILAVTGVSLLCQESNGGEINPKGLLLALTTVFTYSTYIVELNKSRVGKMNGMKATFYILLSGSFIFYINILLNGKVLPDSVPDMKMATYLILLALVPTLLSDITLIYAVKYIGSATTAILGCMEPLTAVCAGVLFLGEYMNTIQITGIFIILIAVLSIIVTNRFKTTGQLQTGNSKK